MTERKPAGMSWESWIDRQIRDGTERGMFDDLPGKGRPLPGAGEPLDEMWWVREKLRREEVSFLPPTLAVRKELDETREKISCASTEDEVRRLVATINDRIRYVNSHVTAGPPSTVGPLDVEDVVERWRQSR